MEVGQNVVIKPTNSSNDQFGGKQAVVTAVFSPEEGLMVMLSSGQRLWLALDEVELVS